MTPRLLYEDARRMVGGMRRLVGHLRSAETVDLAMGEFAAEGRIVAPGRPHRYTCRLASARPSAALAVLRVAIAPVGSSPTGAHAYASFGRRLVVPARAALTVTVAYDWLDTAMFTVGGSPLPPDDFSRSSVPPGATAFAIVARLLAPDGAEHDALTIYQALEG